MGTSRRALPLAVVLVAAAPACFGRGPALDPYVDDAGLPPPSSFGDDGSPLDVDLGASFAVTGLDPSHGPWTGGTRTVIAGRGFSSNVAVWIGGVALPPSTVLASDPGHIAVVTPAGAPGPADVKVEDMSTAQTATLTAGFVYDDFAVTPGGGSTSGGTRIALQGRGTSWTAASTVTVGDQPCTSLGFTSATAMTCLTPANSPGTQDVTVTNQNGTVDRASDAFVYSSSPDGYRGGLYGGALDGTLTVLAFDAWTGAPVTGEVIAGSTLASAFTGMLDTTGTAVLTSAKLTGQATVTVAAHCHQPMTYVAVPVDTVTVYLNPTLDPACDQGDPPSSGGYYDGDQGTIQRGARLDRRHRVPAIDLGERPGAGPADAAPGRLRVHGRGQPDRRVLAPRTRARPRRRCSPGGLGYEFTIPADPGTTPLYALAGLEDDSTSPPTFEPFAMGAVLGVAVTPGGTTTGINIPMSTSLDRTLTTKPEPPAPGPRGPDRLQSTVAVQLELGGFAVLPQGTQTELLPLPGAVTFAGVPALDGSLAAASYSLTASAVTGPNGDAPASVVTAVETTDANDPLTLGGFLPIPTLSAPGAGKWSGTHVALQVGAPVDLAVVTVSSGGGLVEWQIVAPGNVLSFDLPDLSRVTGVDALLHGSITTSFSVARIAGFSYGTLRDGQLSSSSWNSYAQDSASGTY